MRIDIGRSPKRRQLMQDSFVVRSECSRGGCSVKGRSAREKTQRAILSAQDQKVAARWLGNGSQVAQEVSDTGLGPVGAGDICMYCRSRIVIVILKNSVNDVSREKDIKRFSA